MRRRVPRVASLHRSHSLFKPPVSERLRSGSVVLRPGEEVALHSTQACEEVLVILNGTATVWCNKRPYKVPAYHVLYIPRDTEHRVVNMTKQPLACVYIVTSLATIDPRR